MEIQQFKKDGKVSIMAIYDNGLVSLAPRTKSSSNLFKKLKGKTKKECEAIICKTYNVYAV